jgi:hypothetical protein
MSNIWASFPGRVPPSLVRQVRFEALIDLKKFAAPRPTTETTSRTARNVHTPLAFDGGSNRVSRLFADGPILCLERAMGDRAGVDAALWRSGRFAAQVYPDLPLASTWAAFFDRVLHPAPASVATAAAAEVYNYDTTGGGTTAAAAAGPEADLRWTVRTVAAQCRPMNELRSRLIEAAVGSDALLLVSGSHPARQLPVASV